MTDAIRHSISRKFMLAILVVTFTTLSLASAVLLAYNIHNFREGRIADLNTQANIVGQISIPALEFNDPRVAKDNLEQLRARQTIIAGGIYTSNGKLFARYTRDDGASVNFPAAPPSDAVEVADDRLNVFKKIMRNGEIIGTVFLQAQYPLQARITQYVFILAAVMIGALMFSTLMALWLQGTVTKPIRSLTEAVNRVIQTRDFSVRVEKTTSDETGILVDAFNSMLAEVGERSKSLEISNTALQYEMQERRAAEDTLRELNNTLEERIITRTDDLRRAHEQLRQSQKLEAVGQLTGGVAHDFNNVLQVISGNLQMLKMSLAGNPDAQRRLESAAFAADRGAKLSSQLLAFARRQPLQPIATNLGRILRDMDDLLRRAIGESIQIELIVSGGLWTAMIDPNQLENVILNLAINARDAMKGQGKLTLEVMNSVLDDQYVTTVADVPPGQYVMLAISDTGCGMSPEVMARVFEPFFTTKPEGQGTGLGLSMVYGFVGQSHGHIRIYSELGSGTTIKIYLPRSDQPEATMPNVLKGPSIGGVETILVVEDDPIVQSTAVDMLSALGYRVLKANDGQAALTVLQSGVPIDLLFTDVVMPGPIRSPDLARQAKQMFPDIEVLFTSGYTQNAIVHGGRLDAGVELISKPYRREDLARKIRHMFRNRSTVSENISAPLPKNEGSLAQTEADTALHILVVDDIEDARTMLSHLLTVLGHRTAIAADAQEAIACLEQSEFDVLLTDVNLPGMSGIELATHVVAANPALGVIFSSGYGDIKTDGLSFESTLLPTLPGLKGHLAMANDLKSTVDAEK